MTAKEAHDVAFQRWLGYERECYLANTACCTFVALDPEPPSLPTIVWPRKELLEFRAAYLLLRNAVSELLDLDPATMTQMEVIVAVAKSRWAKREAAAKAEREATP